MNRTKTPRSLRETGVAGDPSGPLHAGIGLVAAMCIATVTPVAAQSPGATQLPAMTVDAPKPKPAARKAAARPVAPQPVQPAAETAASTSPAPASPGPASPGPAGARKGAPQDIAASTGPSTGAGTSSGPARARDANPYASPAAPYYVGRSASDKVTEPIADTPRTITVVPKEVLEDKGATSVRELVRTTPGMTLGSGEGGNAFGDRVLIRGFDARNDMFVDGIRQSGVTTRETFMAEQVEIFAGPAGSIFGRGTTGGAINIVTKKPQAENFYDFSALGGTDPMARFTLDINQNVSDEFAFRVGALVQEADVAGRDYVYDNRYGGSLATLWKPDPDLRVSLDYFYVYFDQMPDWGVPSDPRTRRPFTESGLSRNNFYGIPSRDFQNNYQHMATAGIEWNVTPGIVLSNRLRYSYTVTDYVAGKPGTPSLANPDPALWTVPSTPASRYQVSQMLANQTDATFNFDTYGLQHTLVTGMELSREGISQDGYSGLNIECFPNCVSGTNGILLDLFNPDAGSVGSASSPVRNGRPIETTVNTVSLYALDTVNWNDRLYVNLGVRLDNYNISKTPFGGTELARSDLMPNWNAGVLYKVVPTVGLYAAIGTSSSPVGSELDANGDAYGGLATNNILFRPEQNTAVEAGVKWEVLDRQLLLTAALFQTDKMNARETIGSGPSATLQDSAAYRVRGIDLGFAGSITERWSVFGGAVFMNTEMTRSAVPGQVGLPLANIANNSFNILTKYKVTDKWTAGAQATYKGEILGGTLQATEYAPGTVNVGGVSTPTPGGYNTLPGGWRFDLMTDYRITENVTAKLQVYNVFDQVLYDAFYRSSTPYVYIAPGRAAYLTLQARF